MDNKKGKELSVCTNNQLCVPQDSLCLEYLVYIPLGPARTDSMNTSTKEGRAPYMIIGSCDIDDAFWYCY